MNMNRNARQNNFLKYMRPPIISSFGLHVISLEELRLPKVIELSFEGLSVSPYDMRLGNHA